MHRATAKQAQRECEWKRGKGVSSWIVGALVITLTLTREAFSWKPFESDWMDRSAPIRSKRAHLKVASLTPLCDIGEEEAPSSAPKRGYFETSSPICRVG